MNSESEISCINYNNRSRHRVCFSNNTKKSLSTLINRLTVKGLSISEVVDPDGLFLKKQVFIVKCKSDSFMKSSLYKNYSCGYYRGDNYNVMFITEKPLQRNSSIAFQQYLVHGLKGLPSSLSHYAPYHGIKNCDNTKLKYVQVQSKQVDSMLRKGNQLLFPPTIEYPYTSKYIPNSFFEHLESFSKVIVTKDNTGIGFTSGILGHSWKEKVILVEPLVNIIISKKEAHEESEFDNKISFCYGRGDNILECLDSDIIVCTPDQLAILDENHKLFPIINWTLIIDEEHMYESSRFRPRMQILFTILQHQWKGNIILASSTSPLFRIPFLTSFKKVRLFNKNFSTTLVNITEDFSLGFELVNKWKKDKVIVITNDFKDYIRLFPDRDKPIHCHVGAALYNKLISEGYTVSKEPNNLIICSTSSTEGVDFDISAHVVVFSDYSSVHKEHLKLNINTIINALGRPRLGLLESLVCIHRPKKELDADTKVIKSMIGCSHDYITQLNSDFFSSRTFNLTSNDKYYKLVSNNREDVFVVNELKHVEKVSANLQHNLFCGTDWIEKCNNIARHNHIKFNLLGTDSCGSIPLASRLRFQDRVSAFRKYSRKDLDKLIDTLVTDIRTSNYSVKVKPEASRVKDGKTDKNILIAALLAYIINCLKHNSCKEVKRTLVNLKKPERAVNILNLMYFSAYGLNGKFIKKKENNISKKYKCVVNVSLPKHFIPTISILKYMFYPDVKKIKDVLKLGGKKNTPSRVKAQATLIRKAGGLLLNNCTQERQRVLTTRTYNSIAQISSAMLKCFAPFLIVEIDVVSANPLFVDYLTESKLHKKVYSNIMSSLNLSRGEAKVLYNKRLNQHNKRHDKDRIEFFITCGYTKTQAKEIVSWKKDAFYKMTEIEKKLVDPIMNILHKFMYIRKHDAIYIFTYPNRENKLLELLNTKLDTSIWKISTLDY